MFLHKVDLSITFDRLRPLEFFKGKVTMRSSTLRLQLKPSDNESIFLPSGKEILVPKCKLLLNLWTGAPIQNTYGGKAVINFNGDPLFAELVILKLLQQEEWSGVWVDNYRKRFRDGLPEKENNSVTLPKKQAYIIDSIKNKNGTLKGCWDVFAWKNEKIIFVESKRKSKDTIRTTQKKWAETVLSMGYPVETLLLVEWDLKQLDLES